MREVHPHHSTSSHHRTPSTLGTATDPITNTTPVDNGDGDGESTTVDVPVVLPGVTTDPTILPPLTFKFHWTRPSLYLAFLIVFNVVIPCLLYYLLEEYTHIDGKELIGISSAALGVSSCFDAPFRLWKLVKFHADYGPLNDAKWYHLDWFMWAYTIALFTFAFPLAIAPAIPLYDFFIMSPTLLVAPLGILCLVSLFPFKAPFHISSDQPGTQVKPMVFYFLEDLVAVDWGRGRMWRRQMHCRWKASEPFRTLMWHLTLYWALATAVYFSASAAVTWSTPIWFSFGFVLGLFFIWGFVAGVGCWLITRRALINERKWWDNKLKQEGLAQKEVSV